MKLIDIFSYISILGSMALNISKNPFLANEIWLITNIYFTIYHAHRNEYSQSRMFAVFLSFTIIGLINWR